MENIFKSESMLKGYMFNIDEFAAFIVCKCEEKEYFIDETVYIGENDSYPIKYSISLTLKDKESEKKFCEEFDYAEYVGLDGDLFYRISQENVSKFLSSLFGTNAIKIYVDFDFEYTLVLLVE